MAEEKKSMSVGRIILIVVGVIILLGLGTCATCAFCIGVGANEAAKQEKIRQEQTAEVLKQCASTEAVDWATVAAALKDNEAKIATIWKDACVKVNGIVESIDSGFDDRPVVRITAGERFSLNDCRCKPADPSKALNLSKGQKITVWGIGGGEIIGSLEINHCDW